MYVISEIQYKNKQTNLLVNRKFLEIHFLTYINGCINPNLS